MTPRARAGADISEQAPQCATRHATASAIRPDAARIALVRLSSGDAITLEQRADGELELVHRSPSGWRRHALDVTAADLHAIAGTLAVAASRALVGRAAALRRPALADPRSRA